MEALSIQAKMEQQKNDQISKTLKSEGNRLLNFIRKQVGTIEDAEDIYQDVVAQLIDNFDITNPIERIGSWMYRVARNRIIDRGRKKKERVLSDFDQNENFFPFNIMSSEDSEDVLWRTNLMEAVWDALEELPAEQRDIFIEQELNGRSFKELSELSGVSVSTLISRKRYAVLHLREQLGGFYDELINN